jgi:predicted ferric reductase
MTGLPWPWIVARAAGLVAMAWLTLSVVMGLLMSTKLLGGARQARLLQWHRSLSWMGLSALALHVVALLFDPWLDMGPVDALVPLASEWRPWAVAAGVIAAWLSVALALSFRVRARMGVRNWRRLHMASFLAFVLSVVHGLTAGTDLQGGWAVVFLVATCAPVLTLVATRVSGFQRARPAPVRRPARAG